MARGKQRKEINARKLFIASILQRRLEKILPLKTSTVDNFKPIIALLESDIIYSNNLKISLSDCLSPDSHYKNVIPKGYLKALKQLKARLKEAEEKQASMEGKSLAVNLTDVSSTPISTPASQSPIALHKIPLFENTELIDWQKDGRTNQFSRLVIAISRVMEQTDQIHDTTAILNQLDQIWSIARLPAPSTTNVDSFRSFYWQLLQEAIEKFAEIQAISLMPLASAAKISPNQFKIFETFIQKQLTPNSSSAVGATIKSSKKSPIPVKSHPSGELERITDSFDMLLKAKQASKDKKEVTKKIIEDYLHRSSHSSQTSIPNIFVGRLFIGCGYAGMTLMSTDPTVPKIAHTAFKQLEDYLRSPEKTQQLYLETLLISEKDTGHWTKAEHRAEQEHPLLDVAGNANAGDFIPKSHSIDRFKRTNTRHLFYSNTVNMALKSTPPPLFGAKVEKLEARIKHLADWGTDDSSYNFRVKIAIEVETGAIIPAYIYAKSMDFALGMGVGQNISFEDALEYEKLRELSHLPQGNRNKPLALENQGKALFAKHSIYQSEKGYTPIIHGNEFDLSNQERQSIACVKTRRVVIIGGAGGAATAYRISVLGTDKSGYRLQNDKGEFLQDGPSVSLNPNVKIFSRGVVSYRNLAKQATESFEYAKSKGSLHEGYLLIGIKVESDDIILRFHKRSGAKEIDKQTGNEIKADNKHFQTEIVEDNNKYYLLNLHEERCDQLISGMGQDASQIRDLILNEIEVSQLKIMRGHDGHFVCLATNCESIHLHGAMAGNITNKFTEDLAASLRQSDLPRNGNDQNIMPCVLSKLFSFFSARVDQPPRVTFNVNTCLLRRGDLRDGPTEFEQFLDRAGLNKEERETFIEFLLAHRATDETGAGVSFDNLEQYIKQSGLSDKIAIVSSCNIIAINNLTSLDLLPNL